MATTRTPEVVVIGAGAAGLAAARALQALDREVLVLEAKDRFGGRAFTSVHEFGVPFDHGCHWLHSGSLNPFAVLADSVGFRYRRRPVPRRLHLGSRWADRAELRRWHGYARRQWRRIAALARDSGDVATGQALQPDPTWRIAFERWFAMLSAAEPADSSALDQLDYRDSGENWPVREGFGTLISRLADGVPVRLNCTAEQIRRRGEGVEVISAQGRIGAAVAIVTVPAGVLAAGRPGFDPSLPPDRLAAAANVRAGAAEKIAFGFDRNIFGQESPFSAMSLAAGRGMLGFQIRPWGWNMAIGFAGGALARELAALSDDDAAALALGQLSDMFGSTVRRHVTATVRTCWQRDPYILGGYSTARPGLVRQRELLARPWAERILFAGEATSPDFFSTAHGAYLSGLRAAVEAEALL